ncbi:MAG: esterase-like activity of phytase family protein [Rhodobacterales bacterium]
MIRLAVVFLFVAKSLLAANVTLLSTYSWTMPDKAFGGLSSLYLNDQGNRFLATSDRGHFLTGKINRRNGKIIGITEQNITPILTPKGQPVRGKNVDAEGLAVRKDGEIFVSFERNHRVWAYDSVTSAAQKLPKHADFKELEFNASLESLAIDAKGWLYVMPEIPEKQGNPLPVYRYKNKAWDKRLSIPELSEFRATGADFGPDGKFYLLERHRSIIAGYTTRIRRFTRATTGFKDQQVLLKTPYGTHGKVEGISVWQDDQNRIRITLILDNNFSRTKKTELIEYVVN